MICLGLKKAQGNKDHHMVDGSMSSSPARYACALHKLSEGWWNSHPALSPREKMTALS